MSDAHLTKALAAIRDLRAKIDSLENAKREPMAIVGIGCRLPGGVRSPRSFWRLLDQGRDAISEVPGDRWDVEEFYAEDPAVPGRMSLRHGGFLDGVDEFDPYFFGISPREAERMDPQQRLFLEVAWEALEDAGRTRAQLRGSATGVFVGTNCTDYLHLQLADPTEIDPYTIMGGLACAIPNRLSYLLDLRGPSLSMDSACSSSLVAVHLAVQSLRSREIDTAVVGGMNLILSPIATMAHAKGLPLAPDGRCKTFDARADGYVRAEGVSAIVLKRLSDAVADGDRIWAVVNGSAVNQDGLTNGLAAPNGLAQRDVIEAALRAARVEPAQVTLLEAHGTGTSLGDPIEVESLAEVYGGAGQPCALGSVKTNLGHVEAGAGIVGLIKAALSVHHRRIAPNLHFDSLNPHISLEGSRLFVPTRSREWTVDDEHRHAAVSSFGAGGTNAHVILGPAPATDAAEPVAAGPFLVPFSGRTPQARQAAAAALREHLADDPAPLRDIAFTAARRRTQHEHRGAVLAATAREAVARLDEWSAGEGSAAVVTGSTTAGIDHGVVFVFPGQGSQRAGMGRELMRLCPVFRAAVTEVDEAMCRYLGHPVMAEVFAADDEPTRIDFVQPALFAIGVGLAARWRSLGVEPAAVVGHSMGEVAAAHVAGALSLADAVRVICGRSRLLRRVSGRGSMLVVALPMAETDALIEGYRDRVSVAVCNSPTSTVVSGDPAALEEIATALRARNVFCKPVRVDVASHSPQMDPLREDLLAELDAITPMRATVPILSTVTGQVCDGTEFDAGYWVRNLREPVLFWDAVTRLMDTGNGVFVEMSPHPILLSAVEQGFEATDQTGVLIPSMRRDEPEDRAMTMGLAALHCAGVAVDQDLLFPASGRVVSLPGYPWQRERFWFRESGPRHVQGAPLPQLPAVAPAPAVRPLVADGAVRREQVHDTVLDAVTAVLKLDRARVDPGAGFFQLGMDSLLAAQVRSRLEIVFGRKLPATVMFEHPTSDSLAAHLASLLDPTGTPAPEPAATRVAEPVAEPLADDLTEAELLAILADEVRAARAAGSTR
ncbi:acyl transferase domain-containing protein [Actinokineospora baliensis]|uniref:type I polyketide synthase n=1 Tax=Actinokineospora baliensis TaxID=547056 RepID=UPI00195E9E8B|nr:type I polyketide synthase [Actinokineospora baliensis]MBM7776027.1 acyl transferase domain-containing protein [Actinokineospora baliensis]